MRLTKLSDYALRVLLYSAAAGDRLVTIDETARIYDISRAHLMKVVTILTRAGFLRGVRGRSGGFRLARPPEEISLGAVLRTTEPDYAMVECLGADKHCTIAGCCRLPGVVDEALRAFFSVFDSYSLADVTLRPENFGLPAARPQPRRAAPANLP
jgi:Rrf2 family transcriptional regulator, nitric oxide-sensitive transcriptional repressor